MIYKNSIYKNSNFLLPLILTFTFLLMSGCGQQEARLPEVPEIPLGGLEPDIRAHVDSVLNEVRSDPDNADANGKLAMVLQAYRLLESADVVYQRARRFSPDSFEWPYLHGVVLQSMSKSEEALEAYRAAEEIRSGYLPLRQRIADLHVSTGNPDIGREIFQQMITTNPGLATAHYGLGKVHSLEGELAEAALEYSKALDIKPDYSAAHYSLADVLRQQGDTESASRHLALFEQHKERKTEIEDPVLAKVRALSRTQSGLYNVALRFLQQRNFLKAAQTFEQVLENHPDDYGAHSNLIGLYGDLGQPEKAEQHFKAAQSINPEHPKLYNNIGIVRVGNKQLKLAVESFLEAVRLDPEYAGAWKNLGKVQQDLGDTSQALESYRTSVNLNGNDRQAQYFYGQLLISSGSPALAIAPLTAALEPMDIRTPHYMRLLAIAQAESGDPESAIATLVKARALATNSGQGNLVNQIDAILRQIRAKIAGARGDSD